MLRELRIRNFAVVDELRLELGPGLGVLTGETGAGKSILVEAVDVLVGGRPSVDMIRAGEGRAVIEGRFEISDRSGIEALCEEAGVDLEDGWLILRRELRREGRNRSWVNASPATTGLLRALGSRLLDLHGQHEHQRLLDRSEQRRILDAFGEHEGLAARVGTAWEDLRDIEARLEEVRRTAREGRERADYLRFKVEEIDAAKLEPGEDERLAGEAARLGHSEELIEISRGLHEALYESEDSVVERLGALGRHLRELVRIDESASRFLELHGTALHNVEELGRELGRYGDSVEHDPARLGRVRRRLDELYRLIRKYGESVDDVIEAGEETRRELAGIEGADREIERLERERETRAAELAGLAAELTAARESAARRLEEATMASFPALGFGEGRFEVALESLEEPGRHGAERVDLRVTLNPGFPPGPLSRVASGGEMSRLMLALKTALVPVDDVPTLIFDEIDAGVGGEVAHRVAERLLRVAVGHQVLVVTHLAQIAARADAHYVVDKDVESGATRTGIRVVAREARVEELARMLGGDPRSETSRAHAEELLAGRS